MDKMYDDNYFDYLYTKRLSLDLGAIRDSGGKLYDLIAEKFYEEGVNHYGGHATMVTNLYEKYNVLMYPFPQLHELYEAIRSIFRGVVNPSDPYYIQCWLNVFQKGEFIGWHRHWPAGMGVWHGFYCVDVEVEPSYTEYLFPFMKNTIRIPSKDNLLVFGKSEDDRHRSSQWNSDRPRVTIAFDIVPGKHIDPRRNLNHWLPI
ncbi:hypothetical protein [Endothiovibrio diazotrophicus]